MDYSDEVKQIAAYAADEAMRTGSRLIGPDHVVLAILRQADNTATDALRCLKVDIPSFKDFVESQIFRPEALPFAETGSARLDRDSQELFRMAYLDATMHGSAEVRAINLLTAVLHTERCAARSYLRSAGIAKEKLEPYAKTKTAGSPKTPAGKFFSIAVSDSLPS